MRRAALFAVLLTLAGTATAGAPAKDPVDCPAKVRPGDLFLVRVAPGGEAPASLSFLGKTYPALSVPGTPGALFLVGVALDAAPGAERLEIRRAGGQPERRPVRIAARRFAEERLTLPQAMVTPPKALEERIAREQALAAEVYRTSADAKLWDRGFIPPLAQPGAGNFGKRRILNGIPRSPHAGEDFDAPAGTPVKAIASGTVRACADWYYSGNTVLVDHGAGLVSQYLHLERILVEPGAKVAQGQVVGLVGSTGRATGPHLHFGLRLYEQRVDPETLWSLLAQRP